MNLKNLFFVFLFFCLTSNIYGQLKVDISGRTILGNNKTYNNGISFYDNGGSTPFRIFRSSNNFVYLTRGTNASLGIKISPTGCLGIGRLTTGVYHEDIELLQIHVPPGKSGQRIRTQQSLMGETVSCVYVESNVPDYIDCYAVASRTSGQRVFRVTDKGDVYARGYYTNSDSILKKDIELIDNPLEKLMQIRGVSYNFKTPENQTTEIQLKNDIQETASSSLKENVMKQMLSEKPRKHLGVLAQDVEKVLPEAVRTNHDGTKAVAYHELIGLLIEAVKEQQNQIDAQKSEIEELKSIINSSTTYKETSSIHEAINNRAEPKLYQNTPNPFKEKTRISFFLPETIKDADLYIYDMQGKQLKSYKIQERGASSIHIGGSELKSGMYIYTLIADKKETGTYKMILTQ